jgi:predicted anti-sigma-YlaC factor YlaD
MQFCEQMQQLLPQYVADGEPALSDYGALREHLSVCMACQDYAMRLRTVEHALRSRPLVSPGPAMAERVVRTLSRENDPAEEEWHWLPWDVWLPALAFALAILIAVMSIPQHLLAGSGTPTLVGNLATWPDMLSFWLTSLQTRLGETVFRAIWLGVFATTAGLGISISLACWNAVNSESLDHLESRFSSLADRVRHPWRHAH